MRTSVSLAKLLLKFSAVQRASGIRGCLVGTTGYKWETRGGAPEKSALASFFQGSCFAVLLFFPLLLFMDHCKHGRALRECLPWFSGTPFMESTALESLSVSLVFQLVNYERLFLFQLLTSRTELNSAVKNVSNLRSLLDQRDKGSFWVFANCYAPDVDPSGNKVS